MHEKKSLAEEALLQMKQVEEVISENAKGILASTMKEEISQLVKESLSEQEEDDDDDVEMGAVGMEMPDADEMDTDKMDSDDEDSDDDDDSDEETIDLTGASDEEILKVFKAMGEEDGIIIKKDGDDIHLTDNETDSEYLIKLGESMEEFSSMNELDEVDDEDVDAVVDAIFSEKPVNTSEFDTDFGSEETDVVYEIVMDEMDAPGAFATDELYEDDDMTGMYGIEGLDEDDDMTGMYGIKGLEEDGDMSDTEVVYEIEMEEDDDIDQTFGDGGFDDTVQEAYSHKRMKKSETKESMKSIKPKGKVGHGPKFSYEKTTGGFDVKKKEGPKMMGTGKPKFIYKKGENMEGEMKSVKKMETKEASRTYGMGSESGRGLRKGITPNRNLKFEALEAEVSMLREKNEEYRKALNVFREKLNEVAIFNSNLAYATRLFTEHSTTKKEKINILRRFDGVETLKESKSLYKSIKDDLNQVEAKPINESVETKLNKSVSTGSSTTLIESKTYENPQFMRIKDLMGKIS